MIILSENNFELLENVPHKEDPENVLDMVLYPKFFDKLFVGKILDILELMTFGKKGMIWLTDQQDIVDEKNIPSVPFPFFIDKIREDVEKITGLTFNTCLINKDNKLYDKRLGYDFIIPSVSFGGERNIKFVSKLNDVSQEVKIRRGSLLIERSSVNKYWRDVTVPSNNNLYNLSFYNIQNKKDTIEKCKQNKKTTRKKLPIQLESIYLNSNMRTALTKKIRNGLSDIRIIPEGSQCFMKDGINHLSKYIKLIKLIGTGDWGNVYSACLSKDRNCKRKFAIKMSRITDEDFKDPYTETSSAWYEIWMLKDIIRPLVKKNICPNLPLFIDTFLCNKCDFIFRKGDKTHPCVINAMELASGDLRDYLKFGTPSTEELCSALFQIMAGLHAIQMSGQILNNDIKAKNILYYNVNVGGYWHYKIDKHDFYVPNYGKMFVLNDFGVSTIYSPNFQLYPSKTRKTFNLGSRFAINMDETFSPVESYTEYSDNDIKKTRDIKWYSVGEESVKQISKGSTYKIDRKTGQVIISRTVLTPIQKSYLFRKGITTNPKTWEYFEHPYIIPPFEFYNDVQDTLRTFIGGKRSTQTGDHQLYPSITNKFKQLVKSYMGISENSKSREFSLHTYHVLAGSFIKKFFTKSIDYTKKPNGKKISYYDMNKCSNKYS
jgi:hypothetical protein